MLHEFLIENREDILALARAKVAMRTARRPTELDLDKGFPCSSNSSSNGGRPAQVTRNR
jgi:hypothetical protein